ncbi:MAG: hypothetical protein K8R58_00050 [Bacteroidales bacterium]|nr:hypothetical protein [Bacteroidales bacterium]
MNPTNDHIKLLTGHFEGTLTPEQEKHIADMLIKDKSFRKNYLLFQKIAYTIQHKDELEFSINVNKIHNKYFKNLKRKNKIKTTLKSPYGIAAMLILCLAVPLIMWLTLAGKPNNLALYNDYFTHEEMIFITRSADNEYNLVRKASLEFNQGDYMESIKTLNIILESLSNIYCVNYYKGVALMELDSILPAKATLQKVTKVRNLFSEQAEWYLALCFLKENNIREVKKLLEKIIAKDSYYASNAQKLLKELK